MEPYELLDHTADAKFRAYGRTRDEAFSNAIMALTAIATDPAGMATPRSKKITVSAKDLKGLLFDLIGEIIFLIDTEGFLPSCTKDLEITEHGDFCLTATLLGDDAVKYGSNLKAPTYSEMRVEESADGWIIQAVVDI